MPESRAAFRRAAAAAFWLAPVVFLLWLYRDAFDVWFSADDFAWLSLLRRADSFHTVFSMLFTPAAQGTVRPWSEPGYFLALQSLFGLDPLPFRIAALLTASGDAVLITWIVRRLTGSNLAGLLAPVLWIANTALVTGLTWSSACNELMCPLFLLGALALFIRYAETGRRSFWWGQVAVFAFGFGVLEINVVYPALAAAWVVAAKADRHLLRRLLPLAGISAGYFLLHSWLAPLPKTGPYVLHFDTSIVKTLTIYCKWAVAPAQRHLSQLPWIMGAAGLAGALLFQILRRRRAGLFGLAWFAVTIAPLVPLSGHRVDYYLTIPLIGLAIAVAAAAAEASRLGKVAAGAFIALYLGVMVPSTQAAIRDRIQETGQVRTLILGTIAARQTHPGKAIAIQGVNARLFNISFAHRAFAGLGVPDVYLTPDTRLNGTDQNPRDYVPEPEAMDHAITHDEVVVYFLERNHLRNITGELKRQQEGRLVDRLPGRVDIGNSLYSWLLGPEWLPEESGIRWMPGKATLRLGVPQGAGQLELEGRCPSAQLSAAPRHLIVLIDGMPVLDTRIYDPERIFHRLIRLPADMVAKRTAVSVEIRVDPVDRIDGQDYGLVFGKIAIIP